MIELIFCGGGNRRYGEIALKYGFKYGSRYNCLPYFDLYFADVDPKDYDEKKYLEFIYKYKPKMASVIDITDNDTYNSSMKAAELISDVVDIIIFIPKTYCFNDLPKKLGNAITRVGYSVPTKYNRTFIDVECYMDWGDVHLLGGSPHKQLKLYRDFPDNIKSVDGNMHLKMASKNAKFWSPIKYKSDYWRFLRDIEIENRGRNNNYLAFELSCKFIMDEWNKIERESLFCL